VGMSKQETIETKSFIFAEKSLLKSNYPISRSIPIKNSWLLMLPDNDARTILAVALCKCGNNSFFRGSPTKNIEPKYVCSHCGSDGFIDVGDFFQGRRESYWFDFSWEFENYVDNGNYVSTAFFYAPFFDTDKGVISFTKVVILSLILTPQGGLSERDGHKKIRSYRLYSEGSFKEIDTLIVDKLYQHLATCNPPLKM